MNPEADAIRMLRERAKHAAAATEALLRWSYMLEGKHLAESHGVPLPEDGRAAAVNPLRLVKKVASQAGENANPFLRITAQEVLQLLDPEAVPVALAKRRATQRRTEERSIKADADQALAWCVNNLGFEEVTKKVLRLEQMRRRNEEYLSAARRAHSAAATPSGENVVHFPSGAH